MKRYNQLVGLIKFCKPASIIEVGTHNGTRAVQMCREALAHRDKVHYVGYDLFDDADDETNAAELNGKGAGSVATARQHLEDIKTDFPGFTYELVPGNTRRTLHGTETVADFVFIDGGHSVETIQGDYEALKISRVIVFDDYYVSGVDTAIFGCNRLLESVPHEVLPEEDHRKGVGIKLAVVGYSSKWRKAIERVLKAERLSKFTLWRGETVSPSPLMCALNALERDIDADRALEQLRSLTGKRLFFVIKADAIRSLMFWREKLEQYFQITEWFAQGDEVVGTAMPLFLANEWVSRGVMSEDERTAHVKVNIAKVAKRVVMADAHDRRAIVVCYGPSLRETWSQIETERKIYGGDIISVSGSHDFLLRRDIVPDYHVECDPRPHKAKHISRPNGQTKYYLASCVHPDVLRVVDGCDVSLWHMSNGDASIAAIEDLEPDGVLVGGGGSVGLRALALFYSLGYRQFSIYGMDCSFASDKQHAGAHAGKKQAVVDVRCGERWFKTSPVLVTYARHFFDTVARAGGAIFSIHGDSLLQEMCKRANEQKDNAA